ncbi:MAG: ROK family protein [Minisyncoccota bacterium]
MYILFDIGGTKMRIACTKRTNRSATCGEPRIELTPQNFEEGMEVIIKTARELAGDEVIEGVVGGVAGTIDSTNGTVLNKRHLPEWEEKPLQKHLSEALGAPVTLENDAAMVGLGEAVYGAGRGFPIVAYLTISTGVGGARIVNGAIDKSAQGFEPGRMIVDPDNTLCPQCPGNELEDYVSGTAVEKRFGKKPYEISDPAVWDELAKFLAHGINTTIAYWSPDVVVLGGSMMREVGIHLEDVEKHLENIFKITPSFPPIRKAELGDVGGLYGALAYIQNHT